MRAHSRIACCLLGFIAATVTAGANGDLRLVDAARNRKTETVRSLLAAHADVNVPQGDGTTALHWAVYHGDADTADLLIRAGANVNAATDYGVTALALACPNQNPSLVERLLAAGANPNAEQTTGVTPLMECSRTGTAAAVKLLLARGADVAAADTKSGQTALMWAVAGGHADAARALIDARADVRARSRGGFTPLMFAARSGDVDCARMLLEAGADVNDGTPQQGNALVLASASTNEPMAIFLLAHGADANAADRNGITALHNAAQRGLTALIGVRYDEFYRVQPANMPALAKALLARGANRNARIAKDDKRGPDGTPFSLKGATPYFLAAVSGDAALMQILETGGADPHITADGGVTPLMAAARSACTGSCEYRGGNSEVDPVAAQAALESVQLAVEHGADVNAATEDDQTAMHMGAFTGADGVVQFLADKGARVDVQDKWGETPWSMAAGLSTVLRYRGLYGRHESTTKLLLSLGATQVTQAELDKRASALPPR